MLEAKTKIVLFLGFLVQCITAFFAVGMFYPDQHFQYLEFAGHWLDIPNATDQAWEFNERIRPTFGVYMIAGFYRIFEWFGTVNPFVFTTFLRFFTAFSSFFALNYLAFSVLRTQKKVLFYTLILLNFTWYIPWMRTLFGSEMWSGTVWAVALAMLLRSQERRQTWYLFLIGLLLSISFFFRAQIAFMFPALWLWVLVYMKDKYRILLWMSAGFAVGVLFNVWLDSAFYGKFTLTPWRYFYANIIQGKAASFGESSVFFYVVELMIIGGVPVFSVVVFFYMLKSIIKNTSHLFVWTTLCFLVGHSLVGHKEDRFLFPVIQILIIIAGLYFTDKSLKQNSFLRSRFVRYGIVPVSLIANLLPLLGLMFVPYSQTVAFEDKIGDFVLSKSDTVVIYYIDRNPFRTPSNLRLRFYENVLREHPHALQAISMKEAQQKKEGYFCTTFDNAKDNPQIAALIKHKKSVFFSSSLLWKLNQFLDRHHLPPLLDIWILVKL